jgi:hypothetical protein
MILDEQWHTSKTTKLMIVESICTLQPEVQERKLATKFQNAGPTWSSSRWRDINSSKVANWATAQNLVTCGMLVTLRDDTYWWMNNKELGFELA